MITYTAREVQTAILKTMPIGTVFNKEDFEEIKWKIIWADGFKKRGFVEREIYFAAIGTLISKGYLKRIFDKDGKKIIIRVS